MMFGELAPEEEGYQLTLRFFILSIQVSKEFLLLSRRIRSAVRETPFQETLQVLASARLRIVPIGVWKTSVF
jgi:hypothetical protein